MVVTRPKNKEAHPGIPDLPSSKQRAGQSKVTKGTQQKQHELAVTEVAALETELLIEQEHARANACQPAGPGVSKKPHGQITGQVGSQRKPSVKFANLGAGTYDCFTVQVKNTNVRVIATTSPRHNGRDDQTMADMTAVPQKQRSVGGRSGNQTAAVTVEGDGGNLITDEVAWTENQDGGDAEMESADGGSDLKQNSKVRSPNLKAGALNLINRPDRRERRRGKGWLAQ